mmetsp:Transcript_16344/g.52150  ORF Transcript_16344/g.52150 Transcript_16344/m.52150 type:complete len:254 (-) Transcript_16344:3-764(-)
MPPRRATCGARQGRNRKLKGGRPGGPAMAQQPKQAACSEVRAWEPALCPVARGMHHNSTPCSLVQRGDWSGEFERPQRTSGSWSTAAVTRRLAWHIHGEGQRPDNASLFQVHMGESAHCQLLLHAGRSPRAGRPPCGPCSSGSTPESPARHSNGRLLSWRGRPAGEDGGLAVLKEGRSCERQSERQSEDREAKRTAPSRLVLHCPAASPRSASAQAASQSGRDVAAFARALQGSLARTCGRKRPGPTGRATLG